ncbi:periplasmic polyamine-binding protein of ABC transporter [Trichormus variabilis ATCC 29413]|uniref:Periplasmic polyamine-binding protein of ABC transporter n=3 Tax=Nostocales TaxID=1161 RepID=Q3M8L5_TRIV2|nr:periplasmic polyamine-binding protein of ABC transporter [Trichormus variabilis ATCC 29413]MBC1216891.1 extracellular solute-binding protein [Trichormus variabilis ARAD]MBC1256582.1 extracellular solute-binding protein [Trichormus variabilis V5]MBC1267402.1 extracellular solute-binding protein [Trichormus variabilis FSR]MBC1305062.1 extracellular solute-binding protein [Trichormus variabilis N2B]MBC1313915.1 extracellular solute-binding protein [Trichormus variabilis PNB]MBC1328269.1 extra
MYIPKSMDRRSFLLSLGGLTLSQLLVGCTGNNQTQLNVQLLKGSIPGQVVNKFRQSLKQQAQLKFAPVEQLEELYKRLINWQHNPKAHNEQEWTRFIPFRQSQTFPLADLVTLGDYWLTTAIERKLIQPIETAQLKQWSGLDSRWRELVTRNEQGIPDPQGKVWAAPYRWGSTVIVYDREKFKKLGWTPQDWSDLWRNELRSRISLLDQPREVIGLVLKKLGKSYNIENLATVPDLEKELQTLNQQVKFYSSNTYLEPLIIGDTWLAVGWSSDVIPVLARYPQLSLVIPRSGTSIWADLWVSPKEITQDALSSQWIDFCLQPNIARQIALLTKTNSPVVTNIGTADIQESLGSLLLNSQEVFAKGEFLLPLPPEATKQYEALFAKIKG